MEAVVVKGSGLLQSLNAHEHCVMVLAVDRQTDTFSDRTKADLGAPYHIGIVFTSLSDKGVGSNQPNLVSLG